MAPYFIIIFYLVTSFGSECGPSSSHLHKNTNIYRKTIYHKVGDNPLLCIEFLCIFVFLCKWPDDGPHSGPKLVAK